MLSKIVKWFGGPKAMGVQINLDQGRNVYSSGDTVTGEIMLLTESSMNYRVLWSPCPALLYLDLSPAKAVKSIRSVCPQTLLVEVIHPNTVQLLQKSQDIFTGDELSGRTVRPGIPISKGQHAFPFSIVVRTICHLASNEPNDDIVSSRI